MTYSRQDVLAVPELALEQTGQGIPLPQFDEAYLRDLSLSGYVALGTVSVLSSLEDGEQRLLMLHHREYDGKVQPGGAWGLPAETARATTVGRRLKVESTLQTMFRGLREEVGVEVGLPKLQARAIGAYTSCVWPRSYYRPDEFALGVVPIMHFVDPAEVRHLVRNYTPQEETDQIALMTLDEIRDLPEMALRVGTLGCLKIAEMSPFFIPTGPFTPILSPPAFAHPNSSDLKLGQHLL